MLNLLTITLAVQLTFGDNFSDPRIAMRPHLNAFGALTIDFTLINLKSLKLRFNSCNVLWYSCLSIHGNSSLEQVTNHQVVLVLN